MSQLVVSPVTQEQQKVGALPNVKVITDPRLLWRLWKDAEPAVLVTDGLACVLLQQLVKILAAEPLLFLSWPHARANLPRLSFHFPKLIDWKIVEETTTTSHDHSPAGPLQL